MRQYQTEYLELLSRLSASAPRAEDMDAETFTRQAEEENRMKREAVERGTALLRQWLFPVLDDILSAGEEEIGELYEFAGKLMSGTEQRDVGLHYRIHLALVEYARHKGLRDMLIRELYLVGMSLFNFENMLSPNDIRLFRTRMRMCFAEAASYFEKGYDDITDPEIRGYIHRSMGNIALAYDGKKKESAEEKLRVIKRSINILTDPDIRAKTPELPWDLYLYKSHQECTSLLTFLRSGNAGPEVFAQVMDSAQTVQERQLKAARERGEPLQPRWQYAYMAARYHCGAMLLPELLEGIYALSLSVPEDTFDAQAIFARIGAPATYMAYSKQLESGKYDGRVAVRVRRMTDRMLTWLSRAPYSENDELMMFHLRQFLYAYRELPGGISFYELVQDIFAMRYEPGFLRMFITGRIAAMLTRWAVRDCPGKLVGLPGIERPEDAAERSGEIAEFACRSGRLYDAGMVHFFRFESAAPRGLFEEEEAILRLHAYCGAELLRTHDSTAVYADIALGHHLSYDEKSGFPVDFSPKESPVRPMLYIISAADAIASVFQETASRYRPARSLDEALEELRRGSGTVYAPFVVELLTPESRREELRRELGGMLDQAFLDMYRRRKGREE